MKKQVIVALALAIGLFSNAQKNELKAAEKAIKKNNYAEAKSAVMSAESLIGSADDKTKAQFYYLKAKALYANGAGTSDDLDTAVESISKAADLRVSKYKSDIEELQTNMLNTFLTKANSKLQSKQYKMSSFDFERAYKMSPKDTLYLYYAASTAVNGQDYDRSLGFYESLRDMGFTGAGIEYTAVNKETGVEETFDNRTIRDAQITIGTHISPKDKKKKTKSAEIIKNIALIYLQNDETEKAMKAMNEARAANPNDMGLLLTEANVRLKMGEMDKFKALMEEATKMDPENAELQYNLGVIAADSGDKEAAKSYYEKAIALDPNYADAYTNMAVLILDKEQAIVEEMNSLGTSAADDKKYDELREKRKEIYQQAIPVLEKSLSLKPKNIDIMRTLANIFSSIGNTDRYKAMKAKIEALESGN